MSSEYGSTRPGPAIKRGLGRVRAATEAAEGSCARRDAIARDVVSRNAARPISRTRTSSVFLLISLAAAQADSHFDSGLRRTLARAWCSKIEVKDGFERECS